MAFGTLGSTLNDELNRLANGGTYRDKDDMVDEALAAKQWANRENIVPYSTDTVGVLNEIAALGPNRQNWFDFNGVCNYLAGTTGLPAAAALRQITTTGDILTSLAAFYTDATVGTNYIPTTASGYMYLPGVSSNDASTPDSAALDITGDIDIRVKFATTAWSGLGGSTYQSLIYKYSAGQKSYGFDLTPDGYLRIFWSTNGSSDSAMQANDIHGIANGDVKWVRVTLDVNNGASGRDAKFYTSDDGATWTQIGTTVTAGATTNIFASTSLLRIGDARGKFYRAQVRNGIDGTIVFDADLETAMTSQTVTSFTESSANAATVTVNRTTYNFQLDTLNNLGSAGALLPITVGSSLAADSNDAKFLDHTGTNYVYVPGVGGNYLSTPDATALDIVGDIDVRVQIAPDSWTPAATQILVSKFASSGNRSWWFAIDTLGAPSFVWSADGVNFTTATSATYFTFTAGTAKWLRTTFDADNGASGNSVRFFTSDDGTTWTQFGSTITTAGVASIYSSNAPVEISSRTGGGNNFTGKIYRAQIFSDITETTKVLDVDTSVITAGSATSFTAVTGQTVTINRSTSGRKTVAVTQPTWLFGTDDYMEVNNRYMAHSTSDENYVYLSGVTGNNMTVADSPPLDITGDLDIQVKVAMDDWTPAGTQRLVSKYSTSDNQRSYSLYVTSTGYLELAWSNNGTTAITKTSTVTPTVTDGGTLWVRATLDIDNGAAGNDVKFYTSTDGTTWTQLGSTVTTAGTTSVYSGSATLFIGDYSQVNQSAKGKFYRAIIKNGIDGTTVLDANAAVITLPSQTTFTDSSSNAYTVTINKSGVGTFVSTGNYLYLPGINSNQATASDSPALDITGDIDVRVKVSADDWTPAAVSNFIGKWQVTGNQRSWRFSLNTNGGIFAEWSADGTAVISHFIGSIGITDGVTKWVRWTLDVNNGASGNDSKFFTSDDGLTWTQVGATQTTAGVTSIYNSTAALEVGAIGGQNTLRGKFFRAQVLNGIGGTVAFDANFEGSITSLTQASFTESSSNAATVTINRSGSTFRSAGVIDAGYLYPGATNTFSNSTIDYLNFGATDSYTLIGIVRYWNTMSANRVIVGKVFSSNGDGYSISFTPNSFAPAAMLDDGILTGLTQVTTAVTAGQLATITGSVNRSTQLITAYLNNGSGSSSSTSTRGAAPYITQAFPLRIGAYNESTSFNTDMEFIAAAVFRSVLTAKNISDINNYFQGRD